jgi:hypothetical protein
MRKRLIEFYKNKNEKGRGETPQETVANKRETSWYFFRYVFQEEEEFETNIKVSERNKPLPSSILTTHDRKHKKQAKNVTYCTALPNCIRAPNAVETAAKTHIAASSLIQFARVAACCIGPLKTRLFRSLQTSHQTSTTIESKPRRESFGSFFLDETHQCTMRSSAVGHSCCSPERCSKCHQTSLVKQQPKKQVVN